jgi:hypothetical protein
MTPASGGRSVWVSWTGVTDLASSVRKRRPLHYFFVASKIFPQSSPSLRLHAGLWARKNNVNLILANGPPSCPPSHIHRSLP